MKKHIHTDIGIFLSPFLVLSKRDRAMKKERKRQRYRKMNRDTERWRYRDRKTEKNYTTQAILKLATQLSFLFVWITGLCSTTGGCLVS